MTVFRQRTCPKCKRNIDDDAPVCYFCREAARIAESKREPAPNNYWIECLVEREGDSFIHVGRVEYRFKRNEYGRAVCEVPNLGHYRQLLKASRDFVPYIEPEAPQGDDAISTIKLLHSQGKTDSEIASVIGVTRQAVTKMRLAT